MDTDKNLYTETDMQYMRVCTELSIQGDIVVLDK